MDSGGWNTIESDAGVFTYLIEKLGVKDVQFEELLSLDEESLEQLSPIYGVIFLFKYGTETRAPTDDPSTTSTTTSSSPPDGTYDFEAAENLFFASQVINNACGTQALLSVLLNHDNSSSSSSISSSETATPGIDIGPHLRDFLTFTTSFPPLLRGETLTNSDLIRTTHNSFSRSSVFSADPNLHPRPSADEDELYHFIAYTPINNVLYELDGLRPAPISHGPSSLESFPRDVVSVIRRRIERYPAHEIRFNLLALTRDRRLALREAQDWEGVEREEAKRKEWVWENALRGHNFLGFAGEVLKAVVRAKVAEGEESYRKWVADACKETERRSQAKRMRRGGGGGDYAAEAMDLDG